jgi:hypothetical protein
MRPASVPKQVSGSEERAKDGAKAMMDYQASARMVREKTERLKALRLAKEAADKERAG